MPGRFRSLGQLIGDHLCHLTQPCGAGPWRPRGAELQGQGHRRGSRPFGPWGCRVPGCHACLPLPSALHPWLHPAARPWCCAEHRSLQLQHPRRCRAGESHQDGCCQPPQHPARVCLAAAAAGEHPAPCRSCSCPVNYSGGLAGVAEEGFNPWNWKQRRGVCRFSAHPCRIVLC